MHSLPQHQLACFWSSFELQPAPWTSQHWYNSICSWWRYRNDLCRITYIDQFFSIIYYCRESSDQHTWQVLHVLGPTAAQLNVQLEYGIVFLGSPGGALDVRAEMVQISLPALLASPIRKLQRNAGPRKDADDLWDDTDYLCTVNALTSIHSDQISERISIINYLLLPSKSSSVERVVCALPSLGPCRRHFWPVVHQQLAQSW